MMIDVGFFFVFGTLFPAILEEFGESRASTAAIQSVAVGVGPSSGDILFQALFSLLLMYIRTT